MMKRLSQGDRETVKELLKDYDEFIAGVILRNHLWDFKVYPVYFSRSQPEGIEMEVQFERTHRNRWQGSGGSAVTNMLAKAGVKRFTLFDPDELSPDNLKRHVLGPEYVGKPKVERNGSPHKIHQP